MIVQFDLRYKQRTKSKRARESSKLVEKLQKIVGDSGKVEVHDFIFINELIIRYEGKPINPMDLYSATNSEGYGIGKSYIDSESLVQTKTHDAEYTEERKVDGGVRNGN